MKKCCVYGNYYRVSAAIECVPITTNSCPDDSIVQYYFMVHNNTPKKHNNCFAKEVIVGQ